MSSACQDGISGGPAIARQRALLSDAFAGVGWRVPALLAAMPEAPDFYFDAMSLVRIARWSRGRAVLLGDAAWCASPAPGQGTVQALAGVYVLAGELAAAIGNHATAFARYEQTMRGYVEANQAFATRAIGEMLPATRSRIWLRSQTLRLLQRLPWKNLIAGKITQDLQRAANAVTLKPYPFATDPDRRPAVATDRLAHEQPVG